MAVDQKYIDQATSQLRPTHNSQVDSLKNQLAQNQLALDQQKNSVNANYDLNVKNQNLNNRLNKNTVSNTMLGRGLANSSIAISGLAEQDSKNARIQADIERNRANDLGNIDANKALLEQNTNNTIGQMDRDLQDKILALAMQLEDRQWEKDFKDKGFQLQQEAQKYEQQYKDAMLKMEQEKFKFDMGYKNEYLAMQKEAQQAEINYKNAMLEIQRQQASADQAWRYEQLAWEKEKYNQQQQAQQAEKNETFKNKVDNIAVDPSISPSDKYNALTQLYYNQNGNADNQSYLMDTYDRLMNANNNFARSTTPATQTSSQNLYGGISQAEARKKIGYEYNPAYDYITNRR